MYLFCLVFAMSLCVWSPAGKGLTSWLSFVVSAVSLSLSIGILGQVWYLNVSIPDLCTLTYFVTEMVAANTQAVMAKVTDIFASNVHIIWLKTM